MDILGNFNGSLGIGLGQQNGKFFTTITGYQIRRTLDRLIQDLGHTTETMIARLVPVVVVVALEAPIQI